MDSSPVKQEKSEKTKNNNATCDVSPIGIRERNSLKFLSNYLCQVGNIASTWQRKLERNFNEFCENQKPKPVHQNVALPMVRLETRQTALVQGIDGDARLQDTWRHPGGVLPDGEGSGGRAQQAVRFRAELEDGDDVLHRRL
ncbi:hypothetical protein Q3G72_031338 [Acer saccharum]|nr:hypothetical protein Q3G72_031338 [Acer saccharum]